MKSLITTILLLLARTVLGQLQNDIAQHLFEKDFNNFKRYTDTLSNKETHIGAYWKLEREITNGFQERILVIKKSVPDKDKPYISTIYTFRVNIISYDKDIVFYDLQERKSRKINGEWLEYFPTIQKYQNDSLFDLLEISFYKSFGGQLNKKELFVDSIVYGTNCSNAATDPPEKVSADLYVKTKNRQKLSEWIQSTNTEKQIYAVDGFYRLKQKGLKLTGQELHFISNVVNKKGKIRTCSGCIYSNEEIGYITKTFKF